MNSILIKMWYRKLLLAALTLLLPWQGWAQTSETLETALVIADPAARIKALKQFLGTRGSEAERLRAEEATVASWAELAEFELRRNNIERAVLLFREAIGALPTRVTDRLFVDTVIRIPQAVSVRGYREESIVLARQLEQRFKGEALRQASLGEFYMTVEAPLDALRALEAAVALRTEDAELRRRLAQAYRLGLRLNDAIYEYQYVIGLNRKEKRSYFELANLYRARGALAESVNLYRAQLEIEPHHSPSWKGLALAKLAADDITGFDEALRSSREQGDSNDDPAQDVYLQSQAALINLARGRVAAARLAADAAVAIEPRYAWARIAAAEVDLVESKYFEAERNLLAAAKYANFPTLTFTLGKLYLTVEDFDGAIEQFQKAFELTSGGKFRTRLGGTLVAESSSLRELLEPEHQAAILLAEPPTSNETFQIAESLLRIDQLLQKGVTSENISPLYQLVERFVQAGGERDLFRALYLAGRLSRMPALAPKVLELTDLILSKADEATLPPGSLRDFPNYDRDGRRQLVRGRALDYRGWAHYKAGRLAEAEQSLFESIREYGPLPEARKAIWHLGAVRETTGALSEALDLYIAAYEPPAGNVGMGSRGTDLDRSVIEILHRKVHGSLDGLDLKLRRGVDLATIDPARALANVFGRQMPKEVAMTSPEMMRPNEPKNKAKTTDGSKLTARIILPADDPIFSRSAQDSGETAVVKAITPDTSLAPRARLTPAILPVAQPRIAITDPLSPFFNQQKYYSQWDSFRLVEVSQPPLPLNP